MKNKLLKILDDYLLFFPEEKGRQSKLLDYLEKSKDKDIIDWNNFNGHIVAGGFIYAKEEHKFLVLFHKDLKMFLYPGGHVNDNEKSPFQTAKREIIEETGLNRFEQLKLYHFDFRYLFIVDRIPKIKIEEEELSSYKWIDINELENDLNYGKIVNKIKKILVTKEVNDF